MLEKYNIPTLISALKHCQSLEKGKQLHLIAKECKLETNIYVANTLMSMYIKCESLLNSRKMFDGMPVRDAASWTIVILGYADKEQGEVALQLFERMIDEGCSPDARTYVAALKACTSVVASKLEAEENDHGIKACALEKGVDIHSQAVKSSSGNLDIFISNTLVDMYSKCGRIDKSKLAFDIIPQPDVVSWNTMILGYAENGKPELALKLFQRMQEEANCTSDSRTYVAALKACSTLAAAEEGQQLVCGVVKVRALEKGMALYLQASLAGYDRDIFVASIMVDVYAKCGDLVDARSVFERMEKHNQVSWNALMLGYAESNEGDSTLELFTVMQRQQAPSSSPNVRSYVAALKGCSTLAVNEDGVKVGGGELVKVKSLEKGMKIHSQAIQSGCDSSMFVASTLVDMYGKCGSLLDAREVFNRMPFHDVVAWNALILVHAENNNEELAVELFVRSTSICQPNPRTYVAALKACAGLAGKEVGCHFDGTVVKLHSLERGMAIHKLHAERSGGLEPDPFLLNTLLDFYSKCGSMSDASRVFGELTSRRPVISWNALIQGYVDNGGGELALEVYSCMQREQGRCSANAHTYTAALKACGSVLALETGKGVHADICGSGMELEPVVANGLVEFYGKCSCMVGARQVFESLLTVDLPTWNGMLAGYSRGGHTEHVFQTFQSLQEAEQQPDGVTLVYVLAACNHAGLLHKGKEFFNRVAGSEFRVRPSIEHYHCMVDILGRGNELEEALALVKSMPHEPSPVTWITLLGACWKSKNMKVGKVAFRQLVDMDPRYGSACSSAAYSLMANICELEGSVDKRSSIRDELNVFWSELKSAW